MTFSQYGKTELMDNTIKLLTDSMTNKKVISIRNDYEKKKFEYGGFHFL